MLRELRPLREVADARERPGASAFLDDGLRFVLADPVHIVEPDSNRAPVDRALGGTDVHVRRMCLDSASLPVPDERRGRVEAHRLLVQQRAEELDRMMVPEPRGLVCEQPEGRRVRLRKAKTGEADELVVDEIRRLRVDALSPSTLDEAAAVSLERIM